MRRSLISLVGAALFVGLTVTPIDAAKGGQGGKPAGQIRGTYSGTSVGSWFGCAWDPEHLYNDADRSGDWAFYGPTSSGTAGVRAGALKGTMSWQDLYWTGPGPWTFLSEDGRSNLWGHAVMQAPAPNFGMLVTVTGGNGKFASVTGGQFTLTTRSIVGGRVCGVDDPAVYPPVPPEPTPVPNWDITKSWPARASWNWELAADASGLLVGFLTYN